MEKQIKKRGRPPVDPEIRNSVRRWLWQEEVKPAEEQRANKVLAHVFHERLQGMHKQVPAISTLEKKIQNERKEIRKGNGPEDEPWSLVTLKEYPIAPEALPKVLEVYRNSWSHPELREAGLTIRDAQWIAQLSETKALEEWPLVYKLLSQAERLSRSVGRDAHFAFLDDALASMEFGEREHALELREVFEQWIHHR